MGASSKILELFPNLQREWLWWGEGKPFVGDASETKANRFNAQDGLSAAQVKFQERIALLEQDNKRLEDLLTTKDEVIALQRELLEQTRNAQKETQPKKVPSDTSSSTTPDARTS